MTTHQSPIDDIEEQHRNANGYVVTYHFFLSIAIHGYRPERLFSPVRGFDDLDALVGRIETYHATCGSSVLQSMKGDIASMDLSGLTFAEQNRTRALSEFTSTQVIQLLCNNIKTTTKNRIWNCTVDQLEQVIGPLELIALGILQNMPDDVDFEMIMAYGVTDVEHLEAIASVLGSMEEYDPTQDPSKLLRIWAWGNVTVCFKKTNSCKGTKGVGYSNKFLININAIVEDRNAKPSETEMSRQLQFYIVSHSYVLIGVVLFFLFLTLSCLFILPKIGRIHSLPTTNCKGKRANYHSSQIRTH